MDQKVLAHAIRILSMDGVQQANSGHPGAPMGLADIAQVLWRRHLRHNPGNPKWYNRDRFVLSNGHASMLIYSLLHLTGYNLPLDELKRFRQLHSKTAGHPEYRLTPGIETTTGPLGQGIANGAGMALAEKVLAENFNEPGFPIVDHFTYVFAGDGCLMEGISHEACSLAGTLKLGKLILCYDDNGISIDGEVKGWFTDDTSARFASYGWQVIQGVDGHDPEAVNAALEEAKADLSRPSLISLKTHIGFGSPNKQDKESAHGAPLGADEVKLTRKALGWKHDEPFFIPQEIYDAWNFKDQGKQLESQWEELFARYKEQFPEKARELTRRMKGNLAEGWEDQIHDYILTLQQEAKSTATRKASQDILNVLGPVLPELFGGSADLAPSNLTKWNDSQVITGENHKGNYVHFGVREFAMTAMMNGIALHGGFIPYSGTFLIFMEYARNAVRMSSLMGIRHIYIYTHDSIGLGEDGPTHQPVEQMTSLRTTPGMTTWRPADSVETAVAWKQALKHENGPTALLLSRQGLPVLPRSNAQIDAIERGAYVIWETGSKVDILLIATGSEVAIALDAAKQLQKDGHNPRVVSMPSPETFARQDAQYRELVLPASCTRRIAVEAGHKDYWYKYTGLQGCVIGMSTFGESGKAEDLFKHFRFTVDSVVKAASDLP